MSSHLRIGMTRQHVQALLGQADVQSEFDKQSNIDNYFLGYSGGMGVDPALLQLQYDDKGKLLRFRVIHT